MNTAEEYLEEALGDEHDLKVSQFKKVREAMKEYAKDCHNSYMRDLKAFHDFETTKACDIFYRDLETP